MQAVVRNTFIQGTLSIIFVVLTLIVLGAAVVTTIRSLRRGAPADSAAGEAAGEAADEHEDPAVPSRIYAPSGFVPTPAEKELAQQWAETVPARPRGHH
jgi:carbon starvation protein